MRGERRDAVRRERASAGLWLVALLLLNTLLTGCETLGSHPRRSAIPAIDGQAEGPSPAATHSRKRAPRKATEKSTRDDIQVIRMSDREAPEVDGFPIGIGDELRITVWKNDDLTRELRVSPSGVIFFPLVGEIEVVGTGTEDLRRMITERLQEYLADPQVNVDIVKFRSRKVYVLGEVQNPGMVVIEDSATLLDAVMSAGGFTADADLENVLLVQRVATEVHLGMVDMRAGFEGRSKAFTTLLKGGDVVYVLPTRIADAGRFFRHVSEVIRPFVEMERVIIYGDKVERILGGDDSGAVVIP